MTGDKAKHEQQPSQRRATAALTTKKQDEGAHSGRKSYHSFAPSLL